MEKMGKRRKSSPLSNIRAREEFVGDYSVLRIITQYYVLTNWFAYLYGRIQSPRPDEMPDRRNGVNKKTLLLSTRD